MSGSEKMRSGLTRRGFLKATGAVGALAAVGGGASLAGTAIADGNSDDGFETKVCNCTGNCAGHCCLEVDVKDGKAFRITSAHYEDPDMDQCCLKGLSHLQRLYDPNRIKYPMRRVGERGSGEFERISWEEAIAEICENWKQTQEEYGDDSILFFPGSGNLRNDTGVGYDRLRLLIGATTAANSYDNNGMTGMSDSLGYCNFIGNDWRDLRNADYCFVWGGNTTESGVGRFRWVNQARKAGTRFVCIDPVYTIFASKCEEYQPVRPGTDGLLAIGMMRHIIENDMHDKETLTKLSVAPFLVKDEDGNFLRQSDLDPAVMAAKMQAMEDGTIMMFDDPVMVMGVDGTIAAAGATNDVELEGSFNVQGYAVTTAFSLLLERLEEWDMPTIVEYTNIPEETIRRYADIFANNKVTLCTGYGPDHYVNGYTFYHNVCALLMVSGNIGKSGTGTVGSDMSQPGNGWGLSNTYTVPENAKEAKTIYGVDVPRVIETGTDGESPLVIKSMFVYKGNPLSNNSNRLSYLAAWEKIPFIVDAEVYMTETAKYSDILLPVTHYFEDEGAHAGNTYIRINERAVEPAFEAKGDFEIAKLLAEGLGLGGDMSYTREDFNRSLLDNDLAKTAGVTWDALKKNKIMKCWPEEFVMPDGSTTPYSIYGQGSYFSTATGRLQFYWENPAPWSKFGEYDARRECLPQWFEPDGSWYLSDEVSRFPFMFTTERSKYMIHTQFGTLPVFQELEPEPIVKINNQDAETYGIQTGDYVRLFNDYGDCTLKAVVNAGCQPGMLVMDHGWQECHFVDGHYNNLTSNVQAPRYAANNWFDARVDLEIVR